MPHERADFAPPFACPLVLASGDGTEQVPLHDRLPPVTIGGTLSPCQSAAGRESPVTLSEAKGLRSEASVGPSRQMLRFAQHDRVKQLRGCLSPPILNLHTITAPPFGRTSGTSSVHVHYRLLRSGRGILSIYIIGPDAPGIASLAVFGYFANSFLM